MQFMVNAVDYGVYLDFKKVFDKVPHKRLLIKLRAYRVGGKAFAWVKEWLSIRKQRVIIDGESSEWSDVTSGVP